MEDIYVKQNGSLTKACDLRWIFSILARQNIVFKDTFHGDYHATRKVLAGAFFKNKLQVISQVIKEELLSIISSLPAQSEADVVQFWYKV